MIDSAGNEIPVKYVDKYDRLRDAKCQRILARFQKARTMLEKVVTDTLKDIEDIQAARKTPEAERGNFSVNSFDSRIQVQVNQSYNIVLDDRVITARDAMLEYAKKLCLKAGEADGKVLFEMIQEAFAASKGGGLSVGRVLSLCRRNITAKEWVQARDLLMASISTDRGKAYLRVYTRPSIQHDFELLKLDVADCWPIENEDE